MGIAFGKPEKQTKDEIMELRKTREEYMNVLKRFQTSTIADIEKKQLTPETGNLVLAKIKEANTWLEKHPSATYLEITANQDATTQEIQRLFSLNRGKQAIRNAYEVLPSLSTIYFEKQKRITKEQSEALNKEAERIKKWYDKNQSTATTLDFEQEQLQIDTSLAEIITDQEVLKDLQREVRRVGGMPTSDLLPLIKEQNLKQQAAKNQEIDYEGAPKLIISTATSTFFGFLLIVLCISAGSVAANMAIGRTPAMRLLYFIYGAIPVFAPFVLLYAVYIRVVKGPIPIYSVLPISIEPATTQLAKLFWQLIYWVPDQESVKAFKDYEANLHAAVATVAT